ncbi:juvenile hormone esterase-like isoform X3 [Spodoptera frugiperda]|uniref:Carboxylic ester hydrolase n=1 Tax=Spodoptera frugiperda TaxID=7108 RepID=A0A9R0DQ37_SPOFR|nr:juvenile hormone esterase-like isoform X2 [Spodoptera frugiperda]XP_050551512.1 juvenile hormone esterase-like isoform X3 [Spodoptera frugiperda]
MEHIMLWRCSVLVIAVCFSFDIVSSHKLRCNVRMRIESGWVCGLRRRGEYNTEYASFRGIPYGRQPLGELRFKELQPVKPWRHHLDATEEGPICPQHDEVYGRLVAPKRGMSESCIYANVHVPLEALSVVRSTDEYEYKDWDRHGHKKGIPILVFIHGGGFQSGSGDTDVHGPEYLVSKGIIVITFNYRINVFGFLSLNTPKIPGNAGLRDQVTLLRWVQRNARAFGGDPTDVTLAGQSAGAACAHLLSLSNATKGLFKRVIIMSGTAVPSFYAASPIYAKQAATRFLTLLGINSTDPDLIHDQLVKTPLEDILKANSEYQFESGLVSFVPVREDKQLGLERIVDDDPITLMEQGRGKEYPMIVGFTDNECEFFKRRFLHFDVLGRIKANPLVILRSEIPFTTLPNVALALANKVIDRYFHGNLNIDDYLEVCRDTLFMYPAFQIVQWRARMHDAAPVYLYQFAYEADFNAVKVGLNLQYNGTAHVEDLTNIFRENALLDDRQTFPPVSRDDSMKDWMTQFVVDFMHCNKPSCSEPGWYPVQADHYNYENIQEPTVHDNVLPNEYQQHTIKFFDVIEQIARDSSLDTSTTTTG